MGSLLDQLSAMTVTVADTGDIRSIEKFRPRDATTNPSLITAAAQMVEYGDVVDSALRWAEEKAGGSGNNRIVRLAVDRLAVEFGLRILKIVPGRVSTEVDARLSYDTEGTVEKGRYLIQLYEEAGASRERVLVKIASTWEGIRAAEILEREGIHTNLTLLFGMHQAVACAEANVTLISPFVGRILDWHKKQSGRAEWPSHEDPGVVSVKGIYHYYKKHGHRTEIMGASFRNLGEIIELAGCDLLTIAPSFLADLQKAEGTLVRKLDPAESAGLAIERIPMDEASFRAAHEADPMASEKLDEGIRGFTKAIVALEKLLTERLRVLHGHARAGQAARDFFQVYDLDGDGFITREEWAGAEAVFTALDVDGDGSISKAELRKAVANLAKLDADGDGNITQEEAGAGGPGGPMGGMGDPSQMVDRAMSMDANGDGKLTSDEVDPRMGMMLRGADADGDGAISKEELTAAMQQMQQRMGGGGFGGPQGGFGGRGGGDMTERMMAMDKNGDGKITPDEAPEQARAMLRQADADGNGEVDAKEMAQFSRQMGGRMRGAQGQGGPGGRFGRGGEDNDNGNEAQGERRSRRNRDEAEEQG